MSNGAVAASRTRTIRMVMNGPGAFAPGLVMFVLERLGDLAPHAGRFPALLAPGPAHVKATADGVQLNGRLHRLLGVNVLGRRLIAPVLVGDECRQGREQQDEDDE